jgi:hypothetical protein
VPARASRSAQPPAPVNLTTRTPEASPGDPEPGSSQFLITMPLTLGWSTVPA